MMKVVMDTNIIVASLSGKSPYHIIIEKLYSGNYHLVVSNEILLECGEKIAAIFSEEASANFINALLLMPTVIRTEPLFFSRLLADEEDNKFLDIYYASRADYIVTNNRHFNVLKKIQRPVHQLVSIKQYCYSK